jgi:polyisoprenoid-binding protein YceI
MKRTAMILFLTALLGSAALSQTVWTVDNAHSKMKFTVTHLVIAEVDGLFRIYSGTVTAVKPDFSEATVEFTVDINSISTDNDMRDKHLKSDDFFNAEKYPQATFKSTSWKKVDDKRFTLTGDLTIRDVTKPVTFDVAYMGSTKDGRGNEKAGFKATAVINRFDYNLKWNAVTEAGGAVVGRDVTITVNLELAQKKP